MQIVRKIRDKLGELCASPAYDGIVRFAVGVLLSGAKIGQWRPLGIAYGLAGPSGEDSREWKADEICHITSPSAPNGRIHLSFQERLERTRHAVSLRYSAKQLGGRKIKDTRELVAYQ